MTVTITDDQNCQGRL